MTQEEFMATKLTGNVNQEAVQKLYLLKQQQPEVFEKYHSKFIGYANNEEIGKFSDDLIVRIQLEVAQDVNQQRLFSAGNAACTTFSAIATITGSAELSKAVNFSQKTLDFSKELLSLKDAIIAKNVSFEAVFNPSLGLVVLGTQLLGTFMSKATPSFEEIVLKGLQAISNQINELHSAMLEEFHQVHEHLNLLHTTILDCAVSLEILITNGIGGFREDVTQRIDLLQECVNSIVRMLDVDNRDRLINELLNITDRVEARINRHPTIHEEAEVQEIADKLLGNWILRQSAAASLNGTNVYIAGNTDAAHMRDAQILNDISSDKLKSILGYMISIARSRGLQLGASVGDQTVVDPNKIVNPEIFNIAVTEYLRLWRTFPHYIKDNADNNAFDRTLTFAANTSNFIAKLQSSNTFFETLFADYSSTITEVQAAINTQKQRADEIFAQQLPNANVKLNDTFEASLLKFQDVFPGQTSPEAGTTGNYIYPNTLLHKEVFKIPSIIAMAENLGIAKFSATYNGTQTYPVVIHSYNKQEPLNIARIIQGEVSLSRQGGYRKAIQKFDINVNIRFSMDKLSHCKTVKLQDVNNISCYDFSSTQGCGFIHPMNTTQAFDKVISMLHVTADSMAISNEMRQFTEHVRQNVIGLIIAKRKELIITPLLAGNSAAFTTALNKLTATKLRLLAFCKLAGFPQLLLEQISAILPTAENVKQSLGNYNIDPNLDIPYWDTSTLLGRANQHANGVQAMNLNQIRTQIMNLIAQHRLSPTPILKSTILYDLKRTLAEVKLSRNIFLSYQRYDYIREKTNQEKARALGFKIDQLQTTTGLSNSAILCALIEAIIDNDFASFDTIRTDFAADIDTNARIGSLLVLPLHLASYIGNPRVINALIELNPQTINATTTKRFTPLMYAVMSGQLAAVQIFTAPDAQVNLDMRNTNNDTALTIAYKHGHVSIANAIKARLGRGNAQRLVI